MQFKQLSPNDYQSLKPFFKHLKYGHSEYCLPTLLAWITDEYQPYGTIVDNTLFIAAEYKDKALRHLALPVSPDREYSPAQLRNIALDLGFVQYWFVPECYINRYGEKEILRYFLIREQKDSKDYIYRTEDLIGLTGNKYSKKRNLINQFQRNYINKGRVDLEEISSKNTKDCIDFLEEWCKKRGCDEHDAADLACEKLAATNLLNNIDLFDSRGLLLRIDAIACAFGIASPLTEKMAVLQFEKAFENIKGLYQYLDNECIKRLCKGYEYVNKENDMSIAGLVKAKKSYHPVRYIRAFQLTLKNGAQDGE